MKDDLFKDIPNYEGLYQISTTGKIRNHKHHILAQTLNSTSNYYRVHLCKNGKAKWHSIHKLVAETFIPNPDNLPEVNHKDENKLNNNVSNLEWTTHRDNANYGTRIKRIRSKLTNHLELSKPVQCIETGVIYPSLIETQRKTGIFATSIKQVCKGRQKTAGGYHWQYIERSDK